MSPFIGQALQVAAEFLNWQHRFREVEGWLHDLEGYALFQLAAGGGGSGAVVEVGSFMGRSTAFLAAGSMAVGREKVVAIDHFEGSAEHRPGGATPVTALAEEGTTFRRFQENMRRLGLDAHVTPIVADSAEAAARWTGPIRLLFIDGDHSYEGVGRDFAAWSPFVVPRGLVCFHDVGGWPGVTQLYEEVLRGGQFREVLGVHTLRVVERLPPS